MIRRLPSFNNLRTNSIKFNLLHFLIQFINSSPIEPDLIRFNYTTLVIFGDSYSDDGHPRSPEFQSSFSVPPAIGGRYSNGPVWNEFLSLQLSSSTQRVTRLNYAYNGAHINNQLTSNPVPDTETQIKTYLTDLKLYTSFQSNSFNKSKKVLHLIWIGINPLISIWRSSTLNRSDDEDLKNTFKNVSGFLDLQLEELSNQIESLVKDPNVNRLSSQFIILTPPLLHITQLIKSESIQRSHSNSNLSHSYLSLMEMMNFKFSNDLIDRINLISSELSSSFDDHHFLNVIDTIQFWKEVEKKPKVYGITTPGSCLTDLHSIPCQNPTGFQYWDSLHPTTEFHSKLSFMIYEFLEQIQ
ncbi:hypothetical protein DFH28DRAFT_1103958 [Melampsora americana]|nr:hypothetical protein DFH28DRAFT_1103958 [Melampsora americana]